MGKAIRDVMTKANLECLSSRDSILTAAQRMRDKNIGDVLVEEDDRICGIVTDRDIVIRGLADGVDPNTSIGRICSKDLATLSPDDDVDNAVKLMRQKAVRRIPILENGKLIGIVSMGDLAKDRDPKSALADVSRARPNT